jgi:glutamyl-tRNA reductase
MPCFEHNRKWQSIESRSKLAHKLHTTRKASALQNKTASVTEASKESTSEYSEISRSPAISQQTRSVSANASDTYNPSDLVNKLNLKEGDLDKLSDSLIEKLTHEITSTLNNTRDDLSSNKTGQLASFKSECEVKTDQDVTDIGFINDGKHII